jgi:hypothetical protein
MVPVRFLSLTSVKDCTYWVEILGEIGMRSKALLVELLLD